MKTGSGGSLARSTHSESGLSESFFFKERRKKQIKVFEEFTTKLVYQEDIQKRESWGMGRQDG